MMPCVCSRSSNKQKAFNLCVNIMTNMSTKSYDSIFIKIGPVAMNTKIEHKNNHASYIN